jgi:elongation factor G
MGEVRAVALVGPNGSGKTSLFEALLAATGTLSRAGSVEAGTSLGDATPEARARRQSTEIAVADMAWLGDRFALVDTPGSVHFAHDAARLLPALDLAIVVVDPDPARAGLAQPALRALEAAGTPHLIFVNRIDQARGRIRDLVEALQPMSSAPLVARQIPIREGEQVTGFVDLALERAWRYRPGKPSEPIDIPEALTEREHEARFHMLEQLADHDDALLEALVEGIEPDAARVFADLRGELAANQIVPVLFGSATGGWGITRLLKAIRHETPAPAVAAGRVGARGGALVFKVSNAAAVGRLALARLFGTLPAGATAFALKGEETAKATVAGVGAIVGLAKSDVAAPEALASGPVSLIVTPRDRKDDVRLSGALHKLVEEDLGLRLERDEETGHVALRGQSDEHLRLALDRLARRYGVAADTAPPPTPYREAIRGKAAYRARHKKQSGGHGQFADVAVEIWPRAPGEGFAFESRVTGGAIPKQYFSACEHGARDALAEGPLGFPVVDVGVAITDGLAHSVDSSDLAFRTAARMAVHEALKVARPYLLEPVARVTIETPQHATARLTSAVAGRRGHLLGFEPLDGWAGWDRVEATLPMAEVVALAAEARAQSQGLARLSATFDHLAELGGKLAEDVVAKAKLAA